MASDINQSPRQTVLQFSLRGIFLATLAAALLSAIAAPLLRTSDSHKQTTTYWFMAEVFTGALLWTAFRCWRRYQVEQLCGSTLLTLPMSPRRSQRFTIISQFLAAAAFAFMAIMQIYRDADSSIPIYFAAQHLITGMLLSQFFLSIWWKGIPLSIEFCRSGVIVGATDFTPWAEFKRYRLSQLGAPVWSSDSQQSRFTPHPAKFPKSTIYSSNLSPQSNTNPPSRTHKQAAV